MRQPSRIALAACVVAAFLLHAPLRRAALTLLRLPFTILSTGVRILVLLPRLPGLAQENDALRIELAQRQLEVSRIQEALRRAGQAAVLAGLAPTGRAVMASVIGRSTLPGQHTVLLDRGAQDGLTVDTVIVDASGLIGRVVELHPASCLVLLLTDPESRVAGLVERSRETGLLVGRGWGHCDFVYLETGADIEEGDRVVTAGLGGPFPKGLLLGTVLRVDRDDVTGSARAAIEPAARLSRLEEVLCVHPTALPAPAAPGPKAANGPQAR
jgi:rod shape-determining protein MreC